MQKISKSISLLFIVLSGILFSCNQDLPLACIDLSTDVIYVDSLVQFNNCSLGADSYIWTFEDTIKIEEKEPFYSFHEAGQYEISLEVKSSSKSDIVFHIINVYTPEQ